MQRTAVWVVTSVIGLAAGASVSAQSATDPTMRVLDATSDVARVLDDLDGRRGEGEGDAREEAEQEARGAAERGRRAAAPPPADRAAERRRPRLDARDDERGESALDDDDVARDPPPALGP